MSEEVLEVNTNSKLPWGVIVAILWSLLLSLSTWTAQRELERSDQRIAALEKKDEERRDQVTVLQTLRPEDKAQITALVESQRRLEMNVAKIMAKLGVEGDQ